MTMKKKIFGKSSPLTKEEMNSYLNGTLSESERRAVEQKIAEDEFNADALEGFEEHAGSMAGFSEVSDYFHGNLVRKITKWKFQYSFIIVIGLAVGIFTIGSFFILESEEKRKEFEKAKRIEKQEQLQADAEKETETTVEKEAPIAELTDEEIDEAVTLPEEKQVKSENVIIESPITLDKEVDSIPEEQKIDEIIIVKEKVSTEAAAPIEQEIDRTVKYSNVKTRYLAELLIIDYSIIYEEGITVSNIELQNGTPAYMANKDDHPDEAMETTSYTKEIEYLDYLFEAQKKFRRNDFKAALKDYKVILKQYNDDVNAHFYSALCYYNINRQKKAIQHFDRVIENTYNTFDEEANWYKAQCLYELGKIADCISLLNKIANSDSFYAKRAADMLEEI